MTFIEQLGLLAAGAIIALLSAWLTDRRQQGQQRASGWLEQRRNAYREFIQAARDIRRLLEKNRSSIQEVSDQIEASLLRVEEGRSDLLLIASESTFHGAEELADW